MTNRFSKIKVVRSLRAALSAIATLFVFTWPSHASFDAIGGYSNVEQRLLADAADGKLDQHSLFDATLIASGVSQPAKLRALKGRFSQLSEQLLREIDLNSPVEERAQAIRSWLHKRVLFEYGTQASDVAKTLDIGVFNCVSASVLYVELARQCGLSVHAVQLPEHVRCEVIGEGLAIPVETTSAMAAGERFSRHGASRVLNDITLLATIYYNRGVAAFDHGDLEAAIELNTIASELDPGCRPARENLLAAINNRVVELVKSHKLDDAQRLLNRGLEIDPEYRPFRANRAYLSKQAEL